MSSKSNKGMGHVELNKEDFPTQLPENISKIILELPPDKQKVIASAIIQKNHYGPLPDSNTIKVYSEVIPNGGDRLMKNVEKQLEHRIEIEKVSIARTYNQSSTGQWMGFIIAIFCLIGSGFLIINDHEVPGTIIGSIDLVALVTVFVVGKVNKK